MIDQKIETTSAAAFFLRVSTVTVSSGKAFFATTGKPQHCHAQALTLLKYHLTFIRIFKHIKNLNDNVTEFIYPPI